MMRDIKISILIAIFLIVSAFVYSNRENLKIIGWFFPTASEQIEEINNTVAGDYFTRFFSESGKDQLLKLHLYPTESTTTGDRAMLQISFEDGSSIWKLGSWDFSDNDQIVVSFSEISEQGFYKPEVIEFVYQDNSLIATKYDKNIYNTNDLKFIKNDEEIASAELKDFTEIKPCEKKMKADSVVFGGFNFTKAFERVVQENKAVNFCGNEQSLVRDYENEILGIDIKEWRWSESGKYISEEEGSVNSYVVVLYSKTDKRQAGDPFNQSVFVYKFDFDKNQIYEQSAFDGSFYVIGDIRPNDFDNDQKEFSDAGRLYLYFKNIEADYEVKRTPFNFVWNSGDGYSIFVPAEESFIISKKGIPYVEQDLVAETYFKKELSIANNFFKQNNFVLSQTNSSTSTLDTSFYDYVRSFKKDNEMCVIEVNPDYMGSGDYFSYSMSVSCSNDFERNKKEQLPFLGALNYKNTNNSVRLNNQLGDFYQVGVGGYRGGSTAVIKKENDTYRVLYISQEGPFCEEIENENMSDEVLKLFKINGCWDGGGYKEF